MYFLFYNRSGFAKLSEIDRSIEGDGRERERKRRIVESLFCLPINLDISKQKHQQHRHQRRP